MPDVSIVIGGIDKFSKVADKISSKLGKIGSKFNQVGKSMTAKLTVPILGVGAASVMASTKVNSAMANIQTMMPQSLARVKELKTGLQELAGPAGTLTKNLAEGQFQLISALGDSSEMMKLTEMNAKAAVGGQASLTEAVDLSTAAMLAWDDKTAEANQKVLDLAFTANKLGKTTFKEMAASIGSAAPLMASLGTEFEDLFSVVAAASGVTGNTSEVMTQLKAVTVSLIKPTTDMQIAYKKLGVSSGEQLIKKFGGLQGALKALQDVSGKYNVGLEKLFSRSEALSLVTALNGKLTDRYTESVKAMGNVTGAATEAFKAQSEGINKTGFAFKKVIASLDVLLQKIGDKLGPLILDLIDTKIAPLLEWFLKLDDKTIKWILSIAGVVAAIGPMLVVISTVISTVATVIQVMGFLATAIKVVGVALMFLTANPIGLVITGIALLIGGIILLVKNWDWFVAAFKTGWKWISENFMSIVNIILIGLGPVGLALKLLINNIDKIINGLKSIARFVLPESLERKLGLAPALIDEEIQRREAVQTIIQGREMKQQQFKGTLNIQNVPPGSSFSAEESGGLDIGIETGLQPVSVGY